MKKRAIIILMTAVACLSFTSCLDILPGLFDLGKDIVEAGDRYTEYKKRETEEMAALVEQYSPVFKEKAAEAYGSGATLTDIRCVENYPEHKNDGYADYAKALIGTLTVDGQQYEAVLSCYGGMEHLSFQDTVHTDAVCSEPVNALPLDRSKIVEVVYPMIDSYDDYGDKLKFSPEITNFDEWVACDNVNNAMYIYIFTTQDISEISQSEIFSSPVLLKMENATSIAEITIVSLKDAEKLAEIKDRLRINSKYVAQAASDYLKEEARRKFFDENHMKGFMIVDCGLHNKGDHPAGEKWDHKLYINAAQ